MLDERFGYREVVQLHQFADHFFALQVLVAMIALVFEAFADFGFEFVKRSGVAHVLGKFIVQFGELLGLDPQHVHRIVEELSRKLGVGIVGGVIDVKILVIANIRAAQVFVERLHGLFGADVAEHAFRLQRLAAAFGRAVQFHLHKIVVPDGAALNGGEGGRTLLHLRERFGDILFREVHFRHFDFKALVVRKGKFRQHIERGAKLHRLPFVEFQLVHLGLRDGRELLLGHGLLNGLRHQVLQHFALDIFREAALDQRNGSLARAESRHARHLGKFLGDFFGGLGNLFGGNFQFEFSTAASVRHFLLP